MNTKYRYMLYVVYMHTCTPYEADEYDTKSHFIHAIVVRGITVVYFPFNV